jgi:hypothetical protein
VYWHGFVGDLTEGSTWGGVRRHGRGRIWLNKGRREDDTDRRIMSIGGEWAFFWNSHTSVYAEADPSENEWSFHAAVWRLFSVWLHIEARWLPQPETKNFEGRKLGVGFHDGSVFWEIWKDPSSWSKDDRWRNSSLNWMDKLFGKAQYQSTVVETHDHVPIPMPEGVYEASITITEDTWRRPRWFARPLDRSLRRAEIKPLDWPDGTQGHIPHPGKGGGSDGLYSLNTPANNVPNAIAAAVERVLLKRWERGKRLTWGFDA